MRVLRAGSMVMTGSIRQENFGTSQYRVWKSLQQAAPDQTDKVLNTVAATERPIRQCLRPSMTGDEVGVSRQQDDSLEG